MYSPEHLNRWEMPSNYFGDTWEEYYGAGVGVHRDSDCLERSNFDSVVKALDIDNRDDVHIVRANHWAVGWVEWIAIHETETECLKIADEIVEGLSDYPVIDETLFCEYEYEEASEIWKNCMSTKERVELCQESYGVSIFAARHDDMPYGLEYSGLLN